MPTRSRPIALDAVPEKYDGRAVQRVIESAVRKLSASIPEEKTAAATPSSEPKAVGIAFWLAIGPDGGRGVS